MAKEFEFDDDGNLEVTDQKTKLINSVLTEVGASWSMTVEQAIKHGVMFAKDMTVEEKAILTEFKEAIEDAEK